MSCVEELLMEGAREYDVSEPTWQEIEEAIARLDPDDMHTLTLSGPDQVQLGISIGRNRRVMINWHDWNATGSYAVVDAAAAPNATVLLEGAEYPALQFVDRSLAILAARAFYETGARAPGLAWQSL